MPAGRPSSFTQEIADQICERLSTGEPLAEICRDEKMPAYRTVYDWAKSHADFSANIARGREEGYDAIALDCLHIADDNGKDTRWVGAEGQEREAPDTEWISRSKLRVDTRLKLLAKWDPKRYGDRTVIAGDVDAPLAVTEVSKRDRAKAMALLVARSRANG